MNFTNPWQSSIAFLRWIGNMMFQKSTKHFMAPLPNSSYARVTEWKTPVELKKQLDITILAVQKSINYNQRCILLVEQKPWKSMLEASMECYSMHHMMSLLLFHNLPQKQHHLSLYLSQPYLLRELFSAHHLVVCQKSTSAWETKTQKS